MMRTEARAAQRMVDAHGQRAWLALVERYGKTFRHDAMVFTCEPEAVRALLMERPHTERRPQVHRFLGRFPGAAGMLFMDGAKWLTRIRALAPVFHRDNVDAHGDALHRLALAHARRWQQQGRCADLYDAVQQLGAAAVLQVGYGLDPDDPLAARLAQALVRYKNNTMVPVPSLRVDTFHVGARTMARLPHIALRMWRDHARVRRVVRKVVRAARTGGDRPNWIGRLLETGMSGRALASELNHLYGAYNAVDYVATAGLYELGRRPELRRSVRAELSQHLGDRERPTSADLDHLPITNGFLLELLRCYPVSMGIVRQTGAPLDLGGERLPAGSQVLILLHALHHHPDYWDNADEFRPDRWRTGGAKVPFSYVPFLFGPRRCQGRDMAEQHLLTLVSAIVRHFDVRVFGEAVVPPFMIPRFEHPIPFAVDAAE